MKFSGFSISLFLKNFPFIFIFFFFFPPFVFGVELFIVSHNILFCFEALVFFCVLRELSPLFSQVHVVLCSKEFVPAWLSLFVSFSFFLLLFPHNVV